MTDPTGAPRERAFRDLPITIREKPRTTGLTEIRGVYYTAIGAATTVDLISTYGRYIDSFKFSAGGFMLLDEPDITRIVDACHANDVEVSTGGYLQSLLPRNADLVPSYLDECKRLGFDIVEVDTGMLSISENHFVALVERVVSAGLKAKAEVGVQFGAAGASTPEALAREPRKDLAGVARLARRCLDAGAYMIMLESEGVTEGVDVWAAEVPSALAAAVGLENVMFEAADPVVFEWYVKQFGPDVNLFVDHTQIAQLATLRTGLWGTLSTWGRVVGLA
jgi:phosphosulfolactate synthase (CoM biosynthesis protein A)